MLVPRASVLNYMYIACLVKNLNREGSVCSMMQQLRGWKKYERWVERKRKPRNPVSRWIAAGLYGYWNVSINQTIILSLKLKELVLKGSVPATAKKMLGLHYKDRSVKDVNPLVLEMDI